MKTRLILIALALLTMLGIASSVRAWDNECRHDCHWQTPHPTKSPTPTVTPTATPEPTPLPYHEPDPKGAPELPVCKQIVHTPQIAWYMDKENGAEFIWSAVEEQYVHTYLIEYKVHGATYNVFVDGTQYDIHADGHVDDVRVAATHEGCVGPFSNWRHTNVEVGSK